MNQAQILHREAMALANEAFSAQRNGHFQSYLDLSKKAFEKEKEAAWLMFEKFDAEPTRSILFRSAAQLAFNCGLIRETEQLISAALVGNPPAEILGDLRVFSKNLMHSLEPVA